MGNLVMPQKTTFEKNRMYQFMSPELKIAMAVLEDGLRTDRNGKIYYDASFGKSWFTRLEEKLKDDVKKDTIDMKLDVLGDEGLVTHQGEIMELVRDKGENKWVRTLQIGEDYIEGVLDIYRFTHNIKDSGS